MIPTSAAMLLDYIGDHEAPRGYDDFYRRAKRPPRPLTSMTVDEVLDWQVWANPPGPGTAAAGRYQIIRPTLEWLKQVMGLTGRETFSKNLQDRMGLRLLQRRGYDDYMAGRITPADFGNALAKEWASMPVVYGPKKGMSYYAGDGVNQSLTRADEFLNLIKNIKSAPQKPADASSRPVPAPGVPSLVRALSALLRALRGLWR